MRRLLGTSVALILLCSGSLFAQMGEMPKPDWYSVYEEAVKPSAVAEYEATTKKMIKWLNDKNMKSPYLHWNTFQTSDMHYIYVIDIENLSDLQKMNETWMGMMMSMEPATLKAMMDSSKNTTDSYGSFLVMRRPDLSYTPEKPRLKPEEMKYIHHDFYYLIPGTEMEAEQIAKDWMAAMKKANYPNGFSVWVGAMGNDLPLWVVSTGAKDAADMAAQNMALEKALGSDQMAALNAKTMKIVRRMDARDLWPRPDLSRPMSK